MEYKKPIIEGDFIEDKNNLILDVKGLIHPPDKVIAYLRYFPDNKGERLRKNGKKYRKVYSLEDREKYLEKNFPEYIYFDSVFGVKLQAVPRNRIKKVHNPIERLQRVISHGFTDELEKDVILFSETLQEESEIPMQKIGVSGSVLVDLTQPDSDIDIIVYGEKNCRLVYEALGNLFNKKDSIIKAYSDEGLKKLYEFRVTDTMMSYEEFAFSEKRKYMSGEINGRTFFLRFLKEPSELSEKYGDVKYISLNNAIIKGLVLDDKEAIFTPCRYIIKHTKTLEGKAPQITEIVSYRGRFCDQVRANERFIAQGKIEKVISKSETYYRLILGGEKKDFLIAKRFENTNR
ncbi:MAG: nucleotidyltransferase domain-containing protein [Candidatus Jordarchaeum sp.]|uniref:nucleotidyltransferase domain-containing protein n=1 Tax=Candidatus Jordarchaeum sp. TaxID=2823881 RepID=UPI00404A260F